MFDFHMLEIEISGQDDDAYGMGGAGDAGCVITSDHLIGDSCRLVLASDPAVWFKACACTLYDKCYFACAVRGRGSDTYIT